MVNFRFEKLFQESPVSKKICTESDPTFMMECSDVKAIDSMVYFSHALDLGIDVKEVQGSLENLKHFTSRF